VPGQPFDVVCAFSLLHLIDDIPNVFEATFRKLKPGGYFLTKTVCLKDNSWLIQVMVCILVALELAARGDVVSFIMAALWANCLAICLRPAHFAERLIGLVSASIVDCTNAGGAGNC
jgi:SAM-dependent methyltransferase